MDVFVTYFSIEKKSVLALALLVLSKKRLELDRFLEIRSYSGPLFRFPAPSFGPISESFV